MSTGSHAGDHRFAALADRNRCALVRCVVDVYARPWLMPNAPRSPATADEHVSSVSGGFPRCAQREQGRRRRLFDPAAQIAPDQAGGAATPPLLCCPAHHASTCRMPDLLCGIATVDADPVAGGSGNEPPLRQSASPCVRNSVCLGLGEEQRPFVEKYARAFQVERPGRAPWPGDPVDSRRLARWIRRLWRSAPANEHHHAAEFRRRSAARCVMPLREYHAPGP